MVRYSKYLSAICLTRRFFSASDALRKGLGAKFSVLRPVHHVALCCEQIFPSRECGEEVSDRHVNGKIARLNSKLSHRVMHCYDLRRITIDAEVSVPLYDLFNNAIVNFIPPSPPAKADIPMQDHPAKILELHVGIALGCLRRTTVRGFAGCGQSRRRDLHLIPSMATTVARDITVSLTFQKEGATVILTRIAPHSEAVLQDVPDAQEKAWAELVEPRAKVPATPSRLASHAAYVSAIRCFLRLA